MIDNDFTFFWSVGQALLHGQNPYTLVLFAKLVYPPALLPLFVLFALISKNVSFILFTILNLAMLLDLIFEKPYRRSNLLWLLFVPTLYVLIVGQLDILFVWIAKKFIKKRWWSVFPAAFLMLKPQLAVLLLPITIIDWLKNDRCSLAAWSAITLALYGLPVVLSPQFVTGWLGETRAAANLYFIGSPGIFSLALQGPLQILLFGGAAAILGGALFLPPQALSAALLTATPLGAWYNQTILTAQAPVKILVPISWLAMGLAAALKATYPFILVPLSALGWYVWTQRRDPQPTLLDWLRASGEPGARGERQTQ